MVSVSKLCCPVCWEFITLLRETTATTATDKSPKFSVRGYHPHIYPLVLPPWISDEIREKMNLKFLGYLGAELRLLMVTRDAAEPARGEVREEVRAEVRAEVWAEVQAREKNHRRQISNSSTWSEESDTALSSISSNSEGEYEDGDSYYPETGATSESSLGWHIMGVYMTWKNM